MTGEKSMLPSADDVIANAGAFGQQLGFGALAGYVSGRFARAGATVGLALCGGAFVALQTLQYGGYVRVDWHKVEREARRAMDANGDGALTADDAKLAWGEVVDVLAFGVPSGAGFGCAPAARIERSRARVFTRPFLSTFDRVPFRLTDATFCHPQPRSRARRRAAGGEPLGGRRAFRRRAGAVRRAPVPNLRRIPRDVREGRADAVEGADAGGGRGEDARGGGGGRREVRSSSHRSPRDRVGAVNADPR